MKYRPTPLNIISGLVIGFSIYSSIYSGPEGWGILFLFYVLPFGIVGLLADFLLLKFLKKYLWTFTIECSILGLLFFYYLWTERTKTFIIPDKLQSKFVATIYGVDNAPELPDGWSYEIKVPSNGILLTSSNLVNDLPQTKMRTYSGIKLNSDDTELGWVNISSDKFDCKGKIYQYQIWMVDSNCCLYSTHDIDSLNLFLKRQVCGQ